TLEKPIWRNTTILRGDPVEEVRALKVKPPDRRRRPPLPPPGTAVLSAEPRQSFAALTMISTSPSGATSGVSISTPAGFSFGNCSVQTFSTGPRYLRSDT